MTYTKRTYFMHLLSIAFFSVCLAMGTVNAASDTFEDIYDYDVANDDGILTGANFGIDANNWEVSSNGDAEFETIMVNTNSSLHIPTLIMTENDNSSSVGSYGIYSKITNPSSSFLSHATGIYGTATKPALSGSKSAKGVDGFATHNDTGNAYGLYGHANGFGTGTKYGVYGTASGSGTRYGVYSNGNLGVNGDIIGTDWEIEENGNIITIGDISLNTGNQISGNSTLSINAMDQLSLSSDSNIFMDAEEVRMRDRFHDNEIVVNGGAVVLSTVYGSIILSGDGIRDIDIDNAGGTIDMDAATIDLNASGTSSISSLNWEINPTGVAEFENLGVGDEVSPNYGINAVGATVGVNASGQNYDFFASGPGVNYGASSSIRWKEDITSIPNALEKVMDLRGVYFNWDKDHGGEHDMGMIAEEVGKVVPEVVQFEENHQYANGLDYGALTPLLTEAIKQLKEEKDAEIEQLQKEVEELKAQLK